MLSASCLVWVSADPKRESSNTRHCCVITLGSNAAAGISDLCLQKHRSYAQQLPNRAAIFQCQFDVSKQWQSSWLKGLWIFSKSTKYSLPFLHKWLYSRWAVENPCENYLLYTNALFKIAGFNSWVTPSWYPWLSEYLKYSLSAKPRRPCCFPHEWRAQLMTGTAFKRSVINYSGMEVESSDSYKKHALQKHAKMIIFFPVAHKPVNCDVQVSKLWATLHLCLPVWDSSDTLGRKWT